MIDHDGRRGDCALGKSAQRDLLSAGRVEIDLLQYGRAGLEARKHFQYHVVLIERCENSGNDALAKGVIKRIVDSRRQDAEA